MPPLLDWRLLKLSDGLTGLMLQVLQMRGHINKSGSHVLLWNQSINLCSYVYYPSTFLAVYQSRTSSDRGDLHQNQSNTNLTFKSDCGPKSYCGTEISEGLTSPVIPWLQPRVLTSCLWRQMMRETETRAPCARRAGPRNGCGVRSSSEKEAERSQWGVEERGLDMKPNLTRLPKIPAPSDTINTFIVFVL